VTGVQTCALPISVIFAQPAQILGLAAYAELARLAADHGNGRAIRDALTRCVLVALAAAIPVFIGLSLFATPLLNLIAGPGFASAAMLVLLLASARVVQLVAPPVSSAIVALGRPGLSVAANVATSLLSWPLLLLLLSWGALVGAGIHAILQAVAVVFVLSISLLRLTSTPTVRR
jgi:O-antigen/teichoic acid export membrane protein